MEYLHRVILSGFVPVLHGDAVLDSKMGCTILSGDVVVRHLAAELRPEFVVFLTNVGGVYDRPPSQPEAVLIRQISVFEDGRWIVSDPPKFKDLVQTESVEHDTTGGMASKIDEAATIAAKGIPVLIVEAGTDHALKALKGDPLRLHQPSDDWIGTIIRPYLSSPTFPKSPSLQ